MGTLSFTATVSLDGYAADASGDFQWSAPDGEVFQFHIERMAAVSTEVLGRRTYQLMRYWEAEPEAEAWTAAEHEFARRWRHVEHIVASSTLARTDLGPGDSRLVPHLDLAELERIVAEADGEVEIFGPTTASAAIRAGLVQDFRFFVVPKVVGGGLPALPSDARLELDLREQRVFGNGTVYLHYAPR
ncbi:dihydrofolate reductase family protein [Brevibacterium sp.]|uniref:dihydrofolate reductase family protein n=1 Tax=Brevibacterium sp. TaxID=1701 RepID=UPI0025C3BF51|nr:dihydrofolate reductase family protein [Brevibacterium sp.]